MKKLQDSLIDQKLTDKDIKMINIEIIEPDELNPFKSLNYVDSDDLIIRSIVINSDNKIIIDRFSEFDDKKNVVTDVIIGSKPDTILAYRVFKYDEYNQEILLEDYKVNGQKNELIAYAKTIISENKLNKKEYWYNGKNEFLFYKIYHASAYNGKFVDDDFFYNINGEILEEIPEIQSYSDVIDEELSKFTLSK